MTLSETVPVNLDVPDAIAKAIASGALSRAGSVVRDASGRIVKHLSETSDGASHDLAEMRSDGLNLLAPALIAMGVTIAGVVVVKTVMSSPRVQALKSSTHACQSASRDGTLTVAHIDRLLADLDAIERSAPRGSEPISERLVDLLVGFIAMLPTADSLVVDGGDGDATPLAWIRSKLETQRGILAHGYLSEERHVPAKAADPIHVVVGRALVQAIVDN